MPEQTAAPAPLATADGRPERLAAALASVTVEASTPRAPTGDRSRVRIPASDAWLIWSDRHNLWWAPDFCGYRRSVVTAGLYTQAAAEDEAAPHGEYPSDSRAMRLLDVIAREVAKGPRYSPGGPRVSDVFDALLAARTLGGPS